MKYLYYESGWIAEVEILQDLSNGEERRFLFKVITTINKGILPPLPDGKEFSVMAKRGYESHCGWYLAIVSEDGKEKSYI